MGVFSGPEISESGLVLALDAGNTKSYPDSVNYYSTPETLTSGRTGTTSGGNYTDFTGGGPDGGRFTRWVRDTGLPGSVAWHWEIYYSNTGLSTGQPVIVSFYARCPNGTVSNITLNSPDSTIINGALDATWRLFVGTALYGGDYVSTPFVRINRSNSNTYENGATYDIALLKVQKGDIWTDLSGRGNTGTLTNGPTYSSANGGSIVFDGVDDNILLPTNFFSFPSLNTFTINLWFKSSQTSGGTLFGQQNTNNPSLADLWVPVIYLQSNGLIRIEPFWTGSASNAILSSSALNNDIWHNITTTFNSGTNELYVDGTYVTNQTGKTLTSFTTTYYYIIGAGYASARSLGTYYFSGNISNFSFYNRALTAAEITQNFNAFRGRFGV